MIIYKATNLVNNKIYIGKTIKTLEFRKKKHIREAKKSNNYFSRALCKYGFYNFKWEILTETDCINKLNNLEKFYIAVYKKMNEIYNMTNGGEGIIGLKFSEEHRKKISIANKGRKRTNEQKKNISISQKGKKLSKETIRKIKKTKKRKNQFVISEETKLKISKANKGYKRSEETKKKISKANKGRKRTDEQKKKQSIAQLKRFENINERIKNKEAQLKSYRDNPERRKKLCKSHRLNLDIDKILKLYNEGKSMSKIANIMNCSVAPISKRINELKIQERIK